MTGSLEAAPDRSDQARVLVADHQPHPTQAAALQRGEEAAPEHLVLAVPDVESEDLAAAVGGDRGGDDHRFGGDQPVVAHVQVGGVQEDVGVLDGIQPAGAELADLLVEGGTDARYL